MLRWQETRSILERVELLALSAQRAALATVIRAKGSAYRKPGAKLLVSEEGECVGGVSAGCLENDVIETALQVLSHGGARVRRYDPAHNDPLFGIGRGCGGTIEVFVRSFVPRHEQTWASRARELLTAGSPVALTCVIDDSDAGCCDLLFSERGAVGSMGDSRLDHEIGRYASSRLAAWRTGEEAQSTALRRIDNTLVFMEILVPPPRVVVFGSDADAIAVATLAERVGFRVLLVDHRVGRIEWAASQTRIPCLVRCPEEGLGEVMPDPRTFVVLMSHSWTFDRAWLELLAQSEAAYIGLLGPEARSKRICAGLTVRQGAQLHAPVAPRFAAEGPDQIAVGIVAELLARHARSRSTSLSHGTEGRTVHSRDHLTSAAQEEAV